MAESFSQHAPSVSCQILFCLPSRKGITIEGLGPGSGKGKRDRTWDLEIHVLTSALPLCKYGQTTSPPDSVSLSSPSTK